MKHFDSQNIRNFIYSHVREKLASQGREFPDSLSEDCDLLLSGLIDSLGVLELLTAIQSYCDREIDFDALDSEHLTVVGPLCNFVSTQLARNDHHGLPGD